VNPDERKSPTMGKDIVTAQENPRRTSKTTPLYIRIGALTLLIGSEESGGTFETYLRARNPKLSTICRSLTLRMTRDQIVSHAKSPS